MKDRFIDKQFRKKSLERIQQINAIINEYMESSYSLTIRQVYYQLVSRDIIPNKQSEYGKISALVTDARRAGLIDWNAIEDRTRYIRRRNHYASPGEAVRDSAYMYGTDLWSDQEHYVEVWVEKDALIGIVQQAAARYDVTSFSCRGYTSDSAIYSAAQRIRAQIDAGKKPVILHLGDHDCSGVDMSRDILERLELFARKPGMIDLHRIALNMDQIQTFKPPVNPAKESDSRYAAYVSRYGVNSWELDALPPEVLTQIIEDNILKHMNVYRFIDAKRKEEAEQAELFRLADAI